MTDFPDDFEELFEGPDFDLAAWPEYQYLNALSICLRLTLSRSADVLECEGQIESAERLREQIGQAYKAANRAFKLTEMYGAFSDELCDFYHYLAGMELEFTERENEQENSVGVD